MTIGVPVLQMEQVIFFLDAFELTRVLQTGLRSSVGSKWATSGQSFVSCFVQAFCSMFGVATYMPVYTSTHARNQIDSLASL